MQCRRQIERDYSAQNARAKISISHAKVHVFKFSRLFHGFLFTRFGSGSRKSLAIRYVMANVSKAFWQWIGIYSGFFEAVA